MIDVESDHFARIESVQLLTVIVPVYNEADYVKNSLLNLENSLNKANISHEIIVVESNSSDDSRDIVVKLKEIIKFKLILQLSPMGKGNAVREAMKSMKGDVFLVFDADGEYNADDIPNLLKPIESGETSFVLGTRHILNSQMRSFNNGKLLAKFMNVAHVFFTYLINFFFNIKLTDPFTMYKVMRVEIFKNVELTSNRFDLDWELVCVALRLGCYPIEIPVYYRSRDFSEGKKIKFFYDPILWIIALFKFRFLPVRKSPGFEK